MAIIHLETQIKAIFAIVDNDYDSLENQAFDHIVKKLDQESFMVAHAAIAAYHLKLQQTCNKQCEQASGRAIAPVYIVSIIAFTVFGCAIGTDIVKELRVRHTIKVPYQESFARAAAAITGVRAEIDKDWEAEIQRTLPVASNMQ